jgi:hypothetical protein
MRRCRTFWFVFIIPLVSILSSMVLLLEEKKMKIKAGEGLSGTFVLIFTRGNVPCTFYSTRSVPVRCNGDI